MLTRKSIGIPPSGAFHMDVDPARLLFRNQAIKGTLVSSLADVAETLEFAARGKLHMFEINHVL